MVIDWSAGTLTATGGSAADLRMPSPDAARPGALRRARARAESALRAALAELPLGGGRQLSPPAIERALSRAKADRVEYQSNGGVVATLSVRFSDWLERPGSPEDDGAGGTDPVLVVDTMPLAAAPLLRAGSRDIAVGAARYRLGAPPDRRAALQGRFDRSGRLSISGDPGKVERLAGATVLIYLHRVSR